MPQDRRETRLHAFSPEENAVKARPAGDTPEGRSVTDVVTAVKKLFANDPALSNVWVKGELSGFNAHPSGHWYFTLKDTGAILSGVMWRTANARVKFRPEEGMEVLARGRIDVYPQRGTMQLVVEELRPVGAGELALRFEQLRKRLEAEGLFSAARKIPLPRFPRTVGIVTSLQAAALRDMVRIATARQPGVRLVVANARVQGEGAAEDIAAALARMDAFAPDVIIVGRGGGSIEDLWAFNEETLVRAVAAVRTPIVSAVGHESDVTLCDLAADARASTPSNACELVVPDAEALQQALDEAETRMLSALDRLVPQTRERIDALHERAATTMKRALQRERERLGADAARLEALSPLAVLARGYAVARKGDATLRRAQDVAEGDEFTIHFHDGEVDAKATRRRTHD